MDWFKVWNGISDDSKMQWVAHKVKQPVAVVLGVWLSMLDFVSSQEDRGSLHGFDVEIMAVRLGVDEQIINDILDCLRLKCMIESNRVSNWDKRQGIGDSTERVRAWREKKKAEKTDTSKNGGNVTVTLHETPVTNGNECNALQHADKDKDKDKETTVPPPPPKGADLSFETFWQAYPRKVGKGAALKAWRKFKFTISEATTVINAVQENAYRNPQWLKDNGQYIPHPATWLNQERWNDSLELPAIQQPHLSERGRQAVSAAQMWLAQQEAQPEMPPALEMEGVGGAIEGEWLP